MMDDEPGKIAGEWFGEYGHIFAMDGALGVSGFFLSISLLEERSSIIWSDNAGASY